MTTNKKGSEDFIRKIKDLSHRFDLWQVWYDFIILTATAVSNSVDKRYYEEREDMYFKAIKKYTPEECNIFPKLVIDMVNELEKNPWQNFLGDIFMELNLYDHWKKQYFSPYHACKLVSILGTENAIDEIMKKGYTNVHDCTCGSGGLLIAAAETIIKDMNNKNINLNWQNHVFFVGQDISFLVGLMCYIQLSYLGCAGYIKIGDVFSDPIKEDDDNSNYWYTPMYFSKVWTQRRLIEKLSKK